jgi:hypothetical protein
MLNHSRIPTKDDGDDDGDKMPLFSTSGSTCARSRGRGRTSPDPDNEIDGSVKAARAEAWRKAEVEKRPNIKTT